MNKRFLDRTLAIGLLIIGFISLSNCASDSRQKRIAKNPEIFGQLSQDHQSLVQQGQISQGMNKKAVYLAWGDPSRSSKGAAAGAQFEKWYYYIYSPSYSGGLYGDYGPRGFYGPAITRTSDYKSELQAQVEFRKGHVTDWENAR